MSMTTMSGLLRQTGRRVFVGITHSRHMAAKPVPEEAEPSNVEEAQATTFPLNYKTGGTDPAILPDSEYPDWVFKLLDGKKTEKQLKVLVTNENAPDAEGNAPLAPIYTEGVEPLTERDYKRYFKFQTLASIKAKNAARAKK